MLTGIVIGIYVGIYALHLYMQTAVIIDILEAVTPDKVPFIGLGKNTSANSYDLFCKLAVKNNPSNIDLTISDITHVNIPTLHPEITAVSFVNI